MNKVGIYGAIFFVCMILCHILGSEFDFEYLYLAEIGLAAVSGIMLYLVIHELYQDIRSHRQAQQEYIDGLKDIAANSQTSFEVAVKELQAVCEGKYTDMAERFTEFARSCDNYVEKLQKECVDALLQCSGLMEDLLPKQEELVKELRAMCQEQSENSNASRTLLEKMESFVRSQTAEIRRENTALIEGLGKENKLSLEAFAQHCGEYTETLQKECVASLEKCNQTIDEFGGVCLDTVDEFVKKSESLMEEYNNCMVESTERHWKRISEMTDKSSLAMEEFIDKSETMMEHLTEAVKKVNEENSQYIQQMKEYQKELMQLNSDDIKIMEAILSGKK